MSEMNNDAMKKRMEEYDQKIRKRLGNSHKASSLNNEKEPYPEYDDEHNDFIPYEGLYGESTYVLPEDDGIDINNDLLINAKVLLPKNGSEMQAARVKERVKDEDGKYIGTYHDNPILDTRLFSVEFLDGSTAQYAANMIIENIFS